MKMESEITMRQKLALNQEMLQSVELLQMTAQELEHYIEAEALENPLIEFRETYSEENSLLKEKLEWLESFGGQDSVHGRTEDEDAGDEDIWNMIGEKQEESLEEFLKEQLLTVSLTGEEKKLLYALIEALDDSGYLPVSPEETAARLSLNPEEADRALRRLQELEPAGVGARNLKECLLLQLSRRYPEEELARHIVEECLELLAKNKLPQIAKKYGATVKEVSLAAEVIRHLEPRPGRLYARGETPSCVIPDVIAVKFRDGYEILLNEENRPKIRVSGYYLRMLQETRDESARQYLLDKYRRALWIQECVRKREQTIVEITKSVIRHQEQFFASGKGLTALTMKTVAGETGLHESTVSRTARRKYLQCPWGIYPLRFFFRGKDQGEKNASFTAEQAKEAIGRLVAREDKSHPLSDQKLMEYLAGQNLAVSRRTVAKYRNILGIPDASRRKEYI